MPTEGGARSVSVRASACVGVHLIPGGHGGHRRRSATSRYVPLTSSSAARSHPSRDSPVEGGPTGNSPPYVPVPGAHSINSPPYVPVRGANYTYQRRRFVLCYAVSGPTGNSPPYAPVCTGTRDDPQDAKDAIQSQVAEGRAPVLPRAFGTAGTARARERCVRDA
eukprot:7971906-Pyramimonas_sp.AAC.1